MSLIDVFIPLVIGLLLIFSPRSFTKATGEKLEQTRKKFRTIGFVLVGVAALYFLIKVAG